MADPAPEWQIPSEKVACKAFGEEVVKFLIGQETHE
jgi:hypothetical protein